MTTPKIIGIVVEDHITNKLVKKLTTPDTSLQELLNRVADDPFSSFHRFLYNNPAEKPHLLIS